MSFFTELRRRNVFRVAAAYAVVAWIMVQIGEAVFPAFGVPDALFRGMVILLVLGFPLALVFAWAFEKTPEGIKLEKNVDRTQSITPVTGKKLDKVIIACLVVAVALLLVDKFFLQGRPLADKSPQAAAQDAGHTTVDAPSNGNGSPSDDYTQGVQERSVAVLPFANLSDDADNAYVASGVHEDILTYLSRVSELRVISRTSVLKYTGEHQDIRAIARELGVSHIVEGSVRKSGKRVRVTAQLIDAVDDEHVWAENYDRDLDDVFAIQTEVAREIVSALETKLSPREAALIAARPTDSIAAYDMYLRAREIMNRGEYSLKKYREAEPLIKAAIAEDPDFALAYLKLAEIYGQYYWSGETSPERRESVRLQIDEAVRIAPDLPEVQLALGEYYYRVMSDFQRALDAFDKVGAQLPNSSVVRERRGLALRRLGRWDESIESLRAAWSLDPANQQAGAVLQDTLDNARHWEESLAIGEQQMDTGNADPVFDVRWAWTRLRFLGDLDSARDVVARIPLVHDSSFLSLRFQLLFYQRDFEAILRLLDDPSIIDLFISSALAAYPEIWRGMALSGLGRHEEAGRSFQDAVRVLDGRKRIYSDEDGFHYSRLAIAQAYLGQREASLAAMARAREVLPESKDHVFGVYIGLDIAIALAVLGENQKALDQLEHQLQVPGGITRWELYLDPVWDSLRKEPRYKALVAEVAGQ